MRAAGARTHTDKTAVHHRKDAESERSQTRENTDVLCPQQEGSERNEELAGAAVSGHSKETESAEAGSKGRVRAPEAGTAGAQAHHSDSSSVGRKSEAHAELRYNLKAIGQLLEQTPGGSKLAEKLQEILRTGTAPEAENLSSELKLDEAGIQKLQEILAQVKAAHKSGGFPRTESASQAQGKLTELLAQVEQALRHSHQGAQIPDEAGQLKQPQVVDGFVLRAEKDNENSRAATRVDDPRFAALLNKSTEFSSLRERQSQRGSAPSDALFPRLNAGTGAQEHTQNSVAQAQTDATLSTAVPDGESSAAGKILAGQAQSTIGGSNPSADPAGLKAASEGANARGDHAALDFSASQKGAGVSNTAGDPGVVSLKNGATMPSARVVDQTVQHLNLHARGDSSVVTVKLHPEELGELNIRMVMEGDQLKLQIQAQNQQVREILEQNFPRLRTAMEDQGVTVEDFQVSLGDSRADDQAGTHTDDDLSRRRGSFNPEAGVDRGVDNLELAEITPASAAAGGLSVHV
jgi:flagellar hook-length control protein FliK